MAFVRWRGNSAQLLTTVYEGGRSRQILLANLHGGYGVADWIRKEVEEKHPELVIDWVAVDESMARGPAHAKPLTAQQWEYWQAEQALKKWAEEAGILPSERATLKVAASLLSTMRQRHGI